MSEQLYCPVPWNSAAVRTNGDYRVCCHTNVIHGGGLLKSGSEPINMGKVPVDDTRNNDILKEIRSQFLRGEWSDSCKKCRTGELHGQRSGRIHAVTRLEEQGVEKEFFRKVVQNTKVDGTIDPTEFPIQEMDIRFGNYCNLSCRSCGPVDSSGWYSVLLNQGFQSYLDNENLVNLERLADGKVVSRERPFAWSRGVDFEKILPKDLSGISRIYFAGGEPLISEDHRRFLEFLIQSGVSNNITLEYNTNLTVITNNLLSLWSKFRSVGVGISMDGVGAYHEYLRHPSKFEKIVKNISVLDNADLNLRAWISCTVSWMNLAHLPDFIFWKHSMSYKKVNNELSRPPISFHLLYRPEDLNLKYIPMKAKQYIESKVLSGIAEMKNRKIYPEAKLNSTEKVLKGMISFMYSEDLSEQWPIIWKKHLELDHVRGSDYSKVDPELFKILRDQATEIDLIETNASKKAINVSQIQA